MSPEQEALARRGFERPLAKLTEDELHALMVIGAYAETLLRAPHGERIADLCQLAHREGDDRDRDKERAGGSDAARGE